jgi:Xaa-Pro aminopeptidase
VTPAEFQQRRRRLVAEFPRRKLHALLLTHPPNVRYLSGFTGSNGALLVDPAGAILFTDPRYRLQAAQESACPVRVARGWLLAAALKVARRRKLRRIGFEAAHFTCQAFEALKESLYLAASLEPASGLVEALRMVKSPPEVALIRRSVLATSEAFQRAMAQARPGMRERELAAELEYQMRLLGADQPAFETIVTSGVRTALPHARSSDRPVARNRLLLIDMGASLEGYSSDMTRMAFFGRPGKPLRQLYRAVLEAQLAALAAVRPGVSAAHVDRQARRVLRAHNLDKAFAHSTGHGLGLEIHEPPRLGRGDKTRLLPGMVFTVEPGAYLEGFGGVRIEDTVVVTPTGCEVLTPTPKELLLL